MIGILMKLLCIISSKLFPLFISLKILVARLRKSTHVAMNENKNKWDGVINSNLGWIKTNFGALLPPFRVWKQKHFLECGKYIWHIFVNECPKYIVCMSLTSRVALAYKSFDKFVCVCGWLFFIFQKSGGKNFSPHRAEDLAIIRTPCVFLVDIRPPQIAS